MTLRETILAKHSKTQTDRIVKWIGNNQQRFDQLFALLFDADEIVVKRTAWPMSYAVLAHPELIQKNFSRLIKKLAVPGIHDAVKRNSIRLMEGISIPKKHHGDVMNLCFDYIADPKEKPAIKAFSLTVLHNLSRQYPDIRHELKILIESQWDNETAAFRARAKKILKEFASKTA